MLADLVDAPGATGDYNTNLSSKAKVGTETLMNKDYDFGFVHVKAVDDAGHDRDPDLKVTWLEKIDGMVKEIIEALAADEEQGIKRVIEYEERRKKGNYREKEREEEAYEDDFFCRYSVVVTGDHSTPALYGDHSCEPVPFVIARVKNVVAVIKDAEQQKQKQQQQLQQSDSGGVKLMTMEGDDVSAFDEISAAQVTISPSPITARL